MRIDGKAIAEKILGDLTPEVATLKQNGIIPTLAVIQVGDDPASTAYIRQKQKAADAIGAKLILSCQQSAVSSQQLQTIIEEYNKDPLIHGIIVQRPLPEGIQTNGILPSKDVDGFLPTSPYPVPVAAAVLQILEEIHQIVLRFENWFRNSSIVVIGRGETAGKPIAEAFIKQGLRPVIIHSQTPNPDTNIRTADVIISCVGKANVVRRDNIKRGALLVSVGIWRDAAGKLHGDYEEDKIKDVASYYTPTPGGVGPVNVACLMANLLTAANKLL